MVNIIIANKKNIKKVLGSAASALKAGKIVAYPTETFYALGVKFDMNEAMERLLKLKKRPSEKALPLIAGNMESLSIAASHLNEASLSLIRRFWPGPLTLLLPAKNGLPACITHEGKVALRVPGRSFALRLALEAGFLITATSANPSDMPPPLTAEEVSEYFGGDVDLIVNAGRTKGGPPSTIADATGDKIKIIRQGAIRIND